MLIEILATEGKSSELLTVCGIKKCVWGTLLDTGALGLILRVLKCLLRLFFLQSHADVKCLMRHVHRFDLFSLASGSMHYPQIFRCFTGLLKHYHLHLDFKDTCTWFLQALKLLQGLIIVLSQLFWESKCSYFFSMNCWDVLLGIISANIHGCGIRDCAFKLINIGLM